MTYLEYFKKNFLVPFIGNLVLLTLALWDPLEVRDGSMSYVAAVVVWAAVTIALILGSFVSWTKKPWNR